MRNLNPSQRRTATIIAACGGIVPFAALQMISSHSIVVHATCGVIAGFAATMAVAFSMKSRRTI